MTRSEFDFDVCCGPAVPPSTVASPPPAPAAPKAGDTASLDPPPAPADRFTPT